MLEVCEVPETINKHQLKIEHRSPPALVVARAMPREKLLSGRGVMEYHLPSVLSKKIRFPIWELGGRASNKKTPIKRRTSISAHCNYWDSSGPRRLRNLWKRYCGYVGLNMNSKWCFQWKYSPLTHCLPTQEPCADAGTALSGVSISVSWMFANYVVKGCLSVGTLCYSLSGTTGVSKRL